MNDKTITEALLPISYKFFIQYRKAICLPENVMPGTSDALELYANMCADEFVIFHKQFCSRFLEKSESGK